MPSLRRRGDSVGLAHAQFDTETMDHIFQGKDACFVVIEFGSSIGRDTSAVGASSPGDNPLMAGIADIALGDDESQSLSHHLGSLGEGSPHGVEFVASCLQFLPEFEPLCPRKQVALAVSLASLVHLLAIGWLGGDSHDGILLVSVNSSCKNVLRFSRLGRRHICCSTPIRPMVMHNLDAREMAV